MAKFITTKYGTKINVEGLTPEQIARVRSVAEDKGAYGTKGAALAKELQKRSQKASTSQGEQQSASGEQQAADESYDLGINKKTGQIDPGTATETIADAVGDDDKKNFNLQNPGEQTDIYGNKQTITIDPDTGEVKIGQQGGAGFQAAQDAFLQGLQGFQSRGPVDLSGAPSILQTGDVRSDAQAAADANYRYMTRDFARSKAEELEAKKQELAERGIPITQDLWQKEVDRIDRKYKDYDDQAQQQALMTRDSSLGALIQGQTTANQAFVRNALSQQDSNRQDVSSALGWMGSQAPTNFTQYQGGESNQGAALMQLLETISDADMAKYGIDKDFSAKLKAIAASNRASNSGGGGGTDSTFVVGGTAPGFGV